MILKRGVSYILLLLSANIVLLQAHTPGFAARVALGFVLAAFAVCFHIVALLDRAPTARLRILNGGYELVLAGSVCFTLEILVYLFLIFGRAEVPLHLLIVNGVVGVLQIVALLLNGALRILLCSKQVGIVPKLSILLFCWVPVVNILLLNKMMRVSHREYTVALEKHGRNTDRKEERLCATKYPLLMVHGVFFRDWEHFNYWGRIPQELLQNGATIHYGNHQSCASVEQCAEELRGCILDLVQRTGCEKVNIIAHSKGGLDARYAVSCLGMGEHVASLTTVNTPHLGCNYVGKLLEKIPSKLIATLGKGYESLYTRLGDDNVDFFCGLVNLTDGECDRLNRLMVDHPAVLYQSVGSMMRAPSSAIFPLSLGHRIIKHYGGGDNDGLVSTQAMAWGNFLGIVLPKGRQGISHADMIDLTRKDIEGFDVCEFYVDLVNKLRLQGL